MLLRGGEGEVTHSLRWRQYVAERELVSVGSAAFHLGWFAAGLKPPSWNTTWSGSSDYDWANARWFIDLARACERAKFDVLLYADVAFVSYDYAGTGEMDLKYSINAPQHDPA